MLSRSTLRAPHLDGDGESLDDFVGGFADDVDIHNSFFGTLHDDPESGGLLVVFLNHTEVERLEGSLVWAQASLNTAVRQKE